MYERRPEDMGPLKYKVGDLIMGFDSGLAIQALVAGIVTEAIQSTSYMNDNSYHIQLRDDAKTAPIADRIDWWIDEGNAVPFEEERWKGALLNWNLRNKALEEATYHYRTMLRTLRSAEK